MTQCSLPLGEPLNQQENILGAGLFKISAQHQDGSFLLPLSAYALHQDGEGRERMMSSHDCVFMNEKNPVSE